MLENVKFVHARTLVLINTSNTPAIVYNATADDVVSYTFGKLLTVGLSHFEYQVNPWKFTLIKEKLPTSMFDIYGFVRPMDDMKMLWLYMIYVYYGNSNIGLFVDFSTIDINDLLGTISFDAITMTGVLALYKSNNVTQTVNDILIPVPRTITFDQATKDRLALLPEYDTLKCFTDPETYQLLDCIPLVTDCYATSVVNIFSQNCRMVNMQSLWRNNLAYDIWYINGNTLDISQRKWLRLLYLNVPYVSNTMLPIQLINTMTTMEAQVLDYVRYHRLWPNNYNSLPADVFNEDYYDDDGDVTGRFWLKRRMGIKWILLLDDFSDKEQYGMTYGQQLNIMKLTGQFGNILPIFIQDNILPSPLPDPTVHVIGTLPVAPDWVMTNGNRYWYSNPTNYDRKRILALLLFVWSVTYNTPFQGPKFRHAWKRNIYRINPYGANQISLWLETADQYKRTIPPDQIQNNCNYLLLNPQISNYGSDDMITTINGSQTNMLSKYLTTWIGDTNTITYHPYATFFSISKPSILLSNKAIIDTPLSTTDMLGQWLQLRFQSLINSVSYHPSEYKGMKLKSKYISIDGPSLHFAISYDQYTLLAELIPIIPTIVGSIYLKYGVFQLNALNTSIAKAYYSRIMKNFNVKVKLKIFLNFITDLGRISLIGTAFKYKNWIFNVTSQTENAELNTITIEGYGK